MTEAMFDRHHAPAPATVDACVHCGFCVPACPSNQVFLTEMDSPRGRIHLMKQGLEGAPLTAAAITHFDRCLGCMACVTACPSGVRYDQLIEDTRAQVERRAPRTRREKLLRAGLFALFPYPRRLRLLRGPLGLYQRSGLAGAVARSGLVGRMSAELGALDSLLPPIRRAVDLPAFVPAQGAKRATVALLTGCVQAAFFSHVNAATARVLAAEGCDVIVPAGQGCCGALSLHTGREEEALQFAKATIATFETLGVDAIVVNSAGCGSAMKEYARALRDEPTWQARAERMSAKVRDVSEFLADLGPVAERHPLPVAVAYHDACHLSHAQRVRAQPRSLLRGIPGLELREVPQGDLCCGSAGVWNILQPEPAAELGRRKAEAVESTAADLLVSGNPGCLLQIARAAGEGGTAMPVRHTIEVLDASVRGVPSSSFLVPRDARRRGRRR